MPQELIEKVIELRKEGHTFEKIYLLTGVSVVSARKYCFGIDVNIKYKHLTEEQKQQIVDLAKLGLSSGEISKKLGFSETTIKKYKPLQSTLKKNENVVQKQIFEQYDPRRISWEIINKGTCLEGTKYENCCG